MQKDRPQPGKMESGKMEPGKMESAQAGAKRQIRAQSGHERMRAESKKSADMTEMMKDPGESQKGIEPEPSTREHPILGKETESMENEAQEQERRNMEKERFKRNKPAA